MASIMRAATAVALSLSLSLVLELPSTASASGYTYIGCFNSSTPMTNHGTYEYQSWGHCEDVCTNISMPAMGLTGRNDCYCGSQMPAESDKVDDSNCSEGCSGYPDNDCGGNNYWSVLKTGVDDSVGYYSGSSSSSSSSSAAASSSSSSTKGAASSSQSSPSSTTDSAVVITSSAPGKTVVVTLSASNGVVQTDGSSSHNKGHKGGSNTAGIAAGVVVGVVGAAAIAGGAFFFFRNRRRKQVMQEYSKRSQAQDYSASSGGISARAMSSVRSNNGNDARLDPEAMLHRRLSDGSIADEQDYSRRILKVTNPDDGR